MKKNEGYAIGDFSKKTGISIRTLRYYDEIGLLTPFKDPRSGHRLYVHRDILTIQQIVSFKFLGYSLEQIITMIKETHFNASLNDTLRIQQRELEEKKSRIEAALKVINRITGLIAEEQEVDSTILLSLIHSIRTEEEQQQWLEQYVSEEAVKELFNKTDEEMETLDKRYIELSTEVKRLAGTPVDDPEVQKLVADQMKMNLEFVGADHIGDFSGLMALEVENPDPEGLPPSPFTPEEEAWLQQAMEYYMIHNG